METEEALLKPAIKYDEPSNGANMAKTLYESFTKNANRTLLVDAQNNCHWTGKQMLEAACRIGGNLIKQVGLKPNDVVMSICEHNSDEIMFALGIIMAGGALYGSSVLDGYEEEKVLCELVPPSVIAANSRLHQMVLELKKNVKGLENTRIVWIDNPTKPSIAQATDQNNNNNNDDTSYYSQLIERDQVILFDDLIKGPLDEALIKRVINEGIKPEEHILTYMLTSGSTGRPKVVPSTHEELMHGIAGMISAATYTVPDQNSPSSKSTLNGYSSHPSDSIILPVNKDCVFSGDLPLDHGAGVNIMFLSFAVGAKFVVMKSYDEDTFWQSVNDHKITTSIASTTFAYKLMLRLKSVIDAGQANKWNLDSLKLIACAGARLAFVDLIKEIKKVYKHISVRQCYGCTEIGFISMPTGKDSQAHIDSVGRLFPGLLAKVVDRETGKLCGAHERGELLVWSRSAFKGYRCHKNDDALKLYQDCHDEKGFYRTGDQVHYDEEERFFVHGRFKDTLILMQDWKILPAELEDIIDQHPLVEFSTVVGMPDPDLVGCHAPKAFLKLIPVDSKKFSDIKSSKLKEKLLSKDIEFIERDVYNFVAQRTAQPKHLKGGVRVLESFPRVGLLNKIDRKALKAMD